MGATFTITQLFMGMGAIVAARKHGCHMGATWVPPFAITQCCHV